LSFLRPFARVDAVEPAEHGLRATLHGEVLRLEAVRADVLRIKLSRGGSFEEAPSVSVCVDPLQEDAGFEVEHADGVVRLRTSALVASLWLDPFAIDVHRPDGSPVLESARPSGAYATLNDAFAIRRRCRPGDAFYGLGEKSGRHNRRGRDFTLWNTDVVSPHASAEFTAGREPEDPRSDRTSVEFDPYYVSIPFFLHHTTDGAVAGSFVDNPYRARYDFTAPESFELRFEGGQHTEYVFAGPALPDVVEAYTWLTGRAPLPPLWALGHHQCRWFRYTQEAVEGLARRHRECAVPCDALWLDIEHMDGYRVFTWDADAFTDVEGMLGRLAEQGIRVVTIVDPGVKVEPGFALFDQGVERDLLCRTEGGDLYVGEVWPGDTAFPDFAKAATRAWWGEQTAAHARRGVAGVWNDMNEPATGAIAPDRMRFDGGRASHARFHNEYALLMAMGTADGLRAARPGERPFVLTRAGSPGIQRYAANWMGDNQSRWDHLWLSIPMACGLGLSGQAFVGADVGGFQGHTSAELFLRWMQYGALTPLCRNHSELGNVDQYAWSFGEAVLGHVRAALELRYRLLPYLYAAFVVASETGAPVQRPLVFDFQDDPAVRDLDDQYLLGRDLLVAPVIAAGQTARQVYLPEGDWYDWHDGELTAGRAFKLVATPMDRIPVFARAGAVIPMWPSAPLSTSGHHPDSIELHLFAPVRDGARRSELQEDDGLTTAAAAGAHIRTTFEVRRSGARVTMRATAAGAGYPEFARKTFRLVVHGAAPAAVEVDGALLRAGSDGAFAIANAGSDFTVALDVS
jgi:alpha-glucosidase